MSKFLIIAFAAISLTGCATMNKPECLNADWQMIGMEDGAKGLPVSYVGQHRSACAKFNIIPDLTRYEQGRAKGLEQFCAESQGYDMGRSGMAYNGVCPAQLEAQFLAGYTQGKEMFSRLMEIKQLSAQIVSDHEQLEKLQKRINEKRQRIISDGTSKGERALLLREIDDLQAQEKEFEKNIFRQKRNIEQRQLEYSQLEKNHR